jgi:hypothetical protein
MWLRSRKYEYNNISTEIYNIYTHIYIYIYKLYQNRYVKANVRMAYIRWLHRSCDEIATRKFAPLNNLIG